MNAYNEINHALLFGLFGPVMEAYMCDFEILRENTQKRTDKTDG